MKRHLYSILLIVIASSIVLELILNVLWGYTSGDIIIYLFTYLTSGIGNIFILICIIITTRSVFKHQHKMFFTLSWVFLAILGVALKQIPIGHFETLGGLLSVYSVNPKQVLSDARKLANDYPSMTCIGNPHQRYPCDNSIHPNTLPLSLQNLHVGNILILDNYVLIEKFGLQGIFRGFVVFRKGFDLWENDVSITRRDCSDCWKIRIIDGLYWYSANPSDRPIFIDPLK